MSEYLLEMKNIVKSFSGVEALKGVNFCVRKGEVRALMGENGAGKSCLIKILTGIYSMDKGEILFNGEKIQPQTSMEAQDLGISTIYQEVNLIPYLSVAENIFLGHEIRGKFGNIDWEETNRQASEILKDLSIDIDVKKPLETYSTAIQQLTAIAKAVSIKAQLIIMDEPTSSLNQKEVEVVFSAIRRLKSQGVSIVYVSHKLDELFDICDSITILRDGVQVADMDMANITRMQLVQTMIAKDVGRQFESMRKRYRPMLESSESICEMNDVHTESKLCGVQLDVRKGEVLGLSGLLGSGRTEVARAIFAADNIREGEIKWRGETVHWKKPGDAIGHALAFCPEERKTDGIIPNMSVRDNISLVLLPRLSKLGIINKKKQQQIVDEFVKKLGVKTPNINQPIKLLSGGNQQKVILARWLCTQPEFLILDEPTRGIDVGAKSEIEKLIQDFANSGISVLMISSETDELLRNCDRVVVMRDGHVAGELGFEDISEDNIMRLMAEVQ